MAPRSAGVNMTFFRRLLATATITCENTRDALSMMSRCPKVGGSNEPGYTAIVLILSPSSKSSHSRSGGNPEHSHPRAAVPPVYGEPPLLRKCTHPPPERI